MITNQPIPEIPALELPRLVGYCMTSLAPHIDVEFLNVFNEDTHNLIHIDVEVKAHSNPGTQTGENRIPFLASYKAKE